MRVKILSSQLISILGCTWSIGNNKQKTGVTVPMGILTKWMNKKIYIPGVLKTGLAKKINSFYYLAI